MAPLAPLRGFGAPAYMKYRVHGTPRLLLWVGFEEKQFTPGCCEGQVNYIWEKKCTVPSVQQALSVIGIIIRNRPAT